MPAQPLNEPFQTIATWHLPEAPETVLTGALEYSPRWTEVELHGTFRPLMGKITPSANAVSYPVMHGTTREGELATVLNAQRNVMNLRVGTGGLQEHETVVSGQLYLGAHVLPDHRFAQISFRVPGLEMWSGESPIADTVVEDTDKAGRTWSYQVALRRIDTTRVDAIKAQLAFRYSLNSKSGFAKVNATVSMWVDWIPDEPQTLRWYLDQQGKLGIMLAFLAGVPMSPDCIESPGSGRGHVISILPGLNNVSYCDYTAAHEFFVRRTALPNFTQIVNRWYEVHSQVDMPSQIALSLMATERTWLNVEFVSLMQVLEGFHRGLIDGTYTTPSRYAEVEAALLKAIPDALDRDHKESLRSRLRYGNEVSLRRRVFELLERLPMDVRRQILGQTGKVAQRWIDTRNYYTHWDSSLRPKVLTNQGLFHANVRLRHLVRVLFLDLMGVSASTILSGLSGGHRASQHLMQINSAEEGAAGFGADVTHE